MKQIVLIGFMGAGKSSVGQKLAEKLDIPLYDTDQLIEKEKGMSIPEIFEVHGEDYFRKEEVAMLEKMKQVSGVISTGGGIVSTEKAQKALAAFPHVVFLNVAIEDLVERIKKDKENVRPLFLNNSLEAFQEIYFKRLPLYQRAGKIIVENQNKGIDEIAHEIILKVGG